MLERDVKRKLLKGVEERFPEAEVFYTDARLRQGTPDILVLNGKNWAMLEVKLHANSRRQPNQEYFVKKLDSMSFCKFVHQDNVEETLDEMERLFQA